MNASSSPKNINTTNEAASSPASNVTQSPLKQESPSNAPQDPPKSTVRFSMAMGAVAKEGYLHKEGAVVKNWKSRYFVLKDKTLHYYKKKGSKTLLGSLNVQGLMLCEAVERKLDFCFKLVSPERVLYLKAHDEDDMYAWIDALKLFGEAIETLPDIDFGENMPRVFEDIADNSYSDTSSSEDEGEEKESKPAERAQKTKSEQYQDQKLRDLENLFNSAPEDMLSDGSDDVYERKKEFQHIEEDFAAQVEDEEEEDMESDETVWKLLQKAQTTRPEQSSRKPSSKQRKSSSAAKSNSPNFNNLFSYFVLKSEQEQAERLGIPADEEQSKKRIRVGEAEEHIPPHVYYLDKAVKEVSFVSTNQGSGAVNYNKLDLDEIREELRQKNEEVHKCIVM